MNQYGILYIIIGVIALLGALVAGYVNFTIGEALGLIQTTDASAVPAGLDIATMQESARTLSTVLAITWVWIIAVIISSVISIRTGLKMLKGKK